MTLTDVVEKLLKYQLHEIKKSALKKLRNPDQLVTIASRLAEVDEDDNGADTPATLGDQA